MKKRIKNLHSLLTWRFDTPWPLLLRGSFVKDFLFFEKKSWWRLSFFFKNRCLLSFSTSASSNSFEITGCYTIKNWIWKKKCPIHKRKRKGQRAMNPYIFFWWRLQKSQTVCRCSPANFFVLCCCVQFDFLFVMLTVRILHGGRTGIVPLNDDVNKKLLEFGDKNNINNNFKKYIKKKKLQGLLLRFWLEYQQTKLNEDKPLKIQSGGSPLVVISSDEMSN